MRGEQRKLDAARRAHLVEDVHHVPLDGVLADREAARDFLVPVAVDHRSQDLLFAPRQPEPLLLPPGRREKYDQSGRNSKVLVKKLAKAAQPASAGSS